MAKQKRLAPPKRPARFRSDESLSLRSAESLGRVIGTLQRQLDSAIRRFGGGTTPHTPRLRAPESAARPERHAPKRPRAVTAEDAPAVRHPPRNSKTKNRVSPSRTARSTVKRASRPK